MVTAFKITYLFFMARQPYMGLGLLVSSRFHDHTHLRHTTVGRIPLDEGPARRRDLYLTTHNTHKRQTSMPPVGFFLLIPGFSPLIHFCSVLVLFRPFISLTVHNRPYNKHITNIHAPGGIFFCINSWVFPFDPFVLLKSFLSCT
jgi:hypothetical protein